MAERGRKARRCAGVGANTACPQKALPEHDQCNTCLSALDALSRCWDDMEAEGLDILSMLPSHAEHRSPSIRTAAAVGAKLSPEAIIRLIRDRSRRVRQAVVFRYDLPDLAVRMLGHHDDARVRTRIAKNPNVSFRQVEHLLHDEDAFAREAMCSRADLPEEYMWELATDEANFVRGAIASREDAPVGLLRQMADSGDIGVMGQLLRNPATPPDILMRQAVIGKHDSFVNPSVADNPMLPTEACWQLWHQARDSLGRSRFAREATVTLCYMASNWNTPHAILDELARLENGHFHSNLLSNPSLTYDLLHEIAVLYHPKQNHAERTFHAILDHPQTDDAILFDLLNGNARSEQQQIMLGHPRTSQTVMDYLRERGSAKTKGILIADDLSLDAAALTELAEGPSAMLPGIVRNPNAPAALLTKFSSDRRVDVRLAIASHANTPPEVCAMLGFDDKKQVRQAAAQNLKEREAETEC